MELKLASLEQEEPQKVIDLLKSQKKEFKVTYDDAAKQYDPKTHAVFDSGKRPDKFVQQYRGKDRNGKAIYETVLSPVTRLAVPYQKLIVERLIGTILGNKIKLSEESLTSGSSETSDLYRAVKKIWKDNKLDFLNRDILRSLLSEMDVAEIWYPVVDENNKIEVKCRIVSYSKGDMLYPYFDSNGSMIAFSREYTVLNEEGKEAKRFDCYTKEGTLKYAEIEGKYEIVETTQNSFGKLPVIYYAQNAPEWYDIQEFCDRQDTLTSNFSDTNDYFGSPMIVVEGKVEGFADKGEQGKIVTLSNNANIKYLTWDSGPESVKMEFDNNEDIIYGSMQIPNFQWSRIQNIGNLQNAILKLFFTDPHMKAETKWEVFGIGVQRRLNLLSSIASLVFGTKTKPDSVIIEPVMEPYVPENLKEVIDSLITATGGEPVMSQQRGVQLNPMVENAESELKILEAEAARRQTESFVIGED